jgi:hypothetical protein
MENYAYRRLECHDDAAAILFADVQAGFQYRLEDTRRLAVKVIDADGGSCR